MSGFLKLLGILMMLVGGGVLLVASSALHEILAATGIGLGAVVLALGTIADLLDTILLHLRAKFPVEDARILAGASVAVAQPQPSKEQEVTWKSRGTR
ncbi:MULTISPECIES: hypothetical protein [unclassified Bosea (in: a-proteobacteria)]|uniref:hypothetical protein n=1 Tax=unclassified Bosea (in: a-proteobacteria) TaxID=2653178 RepID=UPI000F75B2A1|nr:MULTISPECIES: hypothetical protein [unclassified Bosea (in: a-proteobacteria)]AZO77475.1 hypothetical protein BLM15_07515 [Bosea sp. Tri-49]RXT18080.1 hypothetical protein B5U98_22665 [Bosea sp. Tri-39]RXT32678.1 hypothetical protein B5U99_29010 [Bosea sp. Tri-54]